MAAQKSPDAPPANAPNFDQCLARLQQIAGELERTDLPLEQAIQLFEEGMRLSDQCRRQLDEAEGKIEVLIQRGGQLKAEPLDANPLETEEK